MRIRRKVGTVISALSLLAGGAVAMASPASAVDVGGCPSDKLCLYRSTQFRTMEFAAASTSACFNLANYGMGPGTNSVQSYVNNLTVKATFWYYLTGPGWVNSQTIGIEKFSSNAGLTFVGNEKVCTGSARP
ncbi:peptidase inhibitor [Streptomyces sp. NPDC020858]|uniref:peptidase inhibitor n=1 Tax=Streptomyces sp. NPDC020858 TaxID=3365097 RepID=UPI0037977CE5